MIIRKFLLIPLCLLTWAVMAMSAAQAQQTRAPIEERGHRTDAYADAQQRVDFSRKASQQAEVDLKTKEFEFQQADDAMKAAQKQFDETRARREKARKDLSDAANRSTEAKRELDRESAAFEKMRKADAAPKPKK
jgi:septal ring factor EnvC (AmiA/AmiB activator)